MLNILFLIVASVGMLINILALYSSLKILKNNQRVYSNKLDVSLYKEPFNFRLFYVVIAVKLVIWIYSSYAFDLYNLSQNVLKLTWMNNNILLPLFAISSIFYFIVGFSLWDKPIQNHGKITFGAFAVAVSFALTESTHFIIYFLEFKIV